MKSLREKVASFWDNDGFQSATGGRALWSTEFSGYEALPRDLLDEITEEIRQRKGLKAEMPRPENYAG